MVHDHGHRKHPNPIGNEVRRILGPNHALTQGSDQEGFQQIKQSRGGVPTRNQLDQRHVARWIEEVNPTKTRPLILRYRLGQLL